MKKLSVIVPCYNEEGNIHLFYERISNLFDKVDYKFELVFINDGSKDNTMGELTKLIDNNECEIKIINFSRNFGKEAAIYAGLENCMGDYAVIIDADMEQDPLLILNMLHIIEENNEYDSVTYFQEKRKENFLFRFLKKMFYKTINSLSDINFVSGASDFRLINRNMIDTILKLTESNRFSKGIFSWVGFNTYYTSYEVGKRAYGKSSFSLRKSFKLAFNGIVSFTSAPLHIATFLGVLFSLLSFIYLVIVLIQKLFFGINVEGYATIVILILLLGGIQLLVLGIIGEYLAKTYNETKKRPIYVTREILLNKEAQKHDK